VGRAFEYRRAAKEKRWSKMSRIFPKHARAITLAAKNGGPSPDTNPPLRVAIQNAKADNMPKDNIENAIKRAAAKDQKDLEEIIYEGYGPHGVAVMVECTTDNSTRTVANVRSYFNKANGSFGKSGTVDYLFTRRGVFHINAEGHNPEELEFELIDAGLEELIVEEEEIVLLTPFESFGDMQKELERRGIEPNRSEVLRFPNTTTALTPEQIEDIEKMIDKMEEDEDIQAVYHSMA